MLDLSTNRGTIVKSSDAPLQVVMNLEGRRQKNYVQPSIFNLEMSNILGMSFSIYFNHFTVIAGLPMKYDILWLVYQLKAAANEICHDITNHKEICDRLMKDFEVVYRNFGFDGDIYSDGTFSITYKFSYKQDLDSSITFKRSYFSSLECYAQICNKYLNSLNEEELSELGKYGAERKPEYIAYENLNGLHCNMDKDSLYDLLGTLVEYKQKTKDERIYTLINDMIKALTILYRTKKPCVDEYDIYGLRDKIRDYNRNTVNPNEVALVRFLEAVLLGVINMVNGGESTILISSMDSLQDDLRDITQRILYTFIGFNGKAVVVAKDLDCDRDNDEWEFDSLLNSVALYSYAYEIETEKCIRNHKVIVDRAYRVNGDKVSLYSINFIHFHFPEIFRIQNVRLTVKYYKSLIDLVDFDKFYTRFLS